MSESQEYPPNNQIKAEEFIEALSAGIKNPERQMLLTHYHSADYIASRNLWAFVGGCSEKVAHQKYGRLAKKIARRFGYELPSTEYKWTSFLGECIDHRPGQAYLWKMHPDLIKAIEILGWDKLEAIEQNG